MDQNILYAECPCGSGRKFKFCCFPTVRDDLPDDPSRADVTEAIRRRAASKRLAEQAGKTGFVDVDHFQSLIRRGLRRMHGGDYDEAAKIFLEAKEKCDMMPTAYNNLAVCALAQGNFAEAEKWAQEVARRFPAENPFGLAILADLRYAKGDVVGALDVLERAERIEPPSVDQATRVCESMAHFMDHERIVRYVEKSGYADAPAVAFFHGIALANLGRNEEAACALRIAVHGDMSDYAARVLAEVVWNKRPDTICGDWMYFTPRSFSLFAGMLESVKSGGMQQMGLSAEALAELLEVEVNGGALDVTSAIKMLPDCCGKRSERLLNGLRSDMSRPAAVRKAAERAYKARFSKNGLGKKLQGMPKSHLQQMVITEEAETHAPLDPAYEESYFKAVGIAMNLKSGRNDLKNALRLFEDLHAKVPENPAVTNNYASVLSRLGRTDEAMEIIRDCFAQHPDYVFGAANYLKQLFLRGKMDEAKAMVDNYRLPQRIHPDAYLAWMRAELEYYNVVGDEERARNVKKGMDGVVKLLRRK